MDICSFRFCKKGALEFFSLSWRASPKDSKCRKWTNYEYSLLPIRASMENPPTRRLNSQHFSFRAATSLRWCIEHYVNSAIFVLPNSPEIEIDTIEEHFISRNAPPQIAVKVEVEIVDVIDLKCIRIILDVSILLCCFEEGAQFSLLPHGEKWADLMFYFSFLLSQSQSVFIISIKCASFSFSVFPHIS